MSLPSLNKVIIIIIIIIIMEGEWVLKEDDGSLA